jgi:hypothetical protein
MDDGDVVGNGMQICVHLVRSARPVRPILCNKRPCRHAYRDLAGMLARIDMEVDLSYRAQSDSYIMIP